jgi:beta-galactosidase
MITKVKIIFGILLMIIISGAFAESPREQLLIDKEWRFALGHATEASKDYGHGTAYFSYFAKTGYGDGPAAANFDDRAWRVLDLPHDWCVELPFDPKGGHSHGYKAIGRNFPENSVGWYRKKFYIPVDDLGRRIIIRFEGVHRDSKVFVNGFYCGTNHSGYYTFEYDITDYINYGDENTIAVRVEATMEEGWYYEGAGIYRHVWLIKTNPLHVASYGTFITTDLSENNRIAFIEIRTEIFNETNKTVNFDLEEIVRDDKGNEIAKGNKKMLELRPNSRNLFRSRYKVSNPELWSIDKPQLHYLTTIIRSDDKIADVYNTTFGIRTVKFDPNLGFFLNGQPVKIKGTNHHQDHAGLGVAVPDALWDFRIKRLKEMGSNAIRTAHNPPAPALLDACDRLGMLVLDENRLMGVNNEHLNYLENLIRRDRNHPSVFLWSLGNEEWAIEGNIKGARIGTTMQNYAWQLDSSRAVTVAISGGWDWGTGTILQVMGYNYIVQGNIDEHHKKFPWQCGIGTEESNTIGTRGIYFTDEAACHMSPTNRMPENVGTETGWKFYAERPFLAGLFYWTGFDYRGESNPFGWPAVASQFGIVDLCGFPKDIFYYLKSWWTNEPVLYLYPHWNWKGKEGQNINVVVYSNADEVELLVNGNSKGKKSMPVNGHIEWTVTYQPGSIEAKGYKKGKLISNYKSETTEIAQDIVLYADKSIINADGQDIAVITVSAADNKGRFVPDASNEIAFEIDGPARIIGVGNGDPASHENERFVDNIEVLKIEQLKELPVKSLTDCPQVMPQYNDSNWIPAFSIKHKDWHTYVDTLLIVRGYFDLVKSDSAQTITLFSKSILENQTIYINGVKIVADIKRDDPGQTFVIDHKILRQGKNLYAATGKRFRKAHQWDEPNTDPGLIQVITPAHVWKRKLFNGYAQVILQSDGGSGMITLKASSDKLKSNKIQIQSIPKK